jgi:hypothetical protein
VQAEAGAVEAFPPNQPLAAMLRILIDDMERLGAVLSGVD